MFLLTAALALPALLALHHVRAKDIDNALARGAAAGAGPAAGVPVHWLFRNRALGIFALCGAVFELSNAAMLPLVGGVVTARADRWATPLIAACMIVPQMIVAVLSPWVGRRADSWGRRPLLLIAFAAIPIRAVLFAIVASPYLLVAIQALDGVSAAVFGVLYALVVADLTRGTGRFNLAQGIVGVASGIGASLSTPLAGLVADRFGDVAGFLGLAGAGLVGFGLVRFAMPETRPAGWAPAGRAR